MRSYCVYVIELDSDPYSVYVGSTVHTPKLRLAKHLSGTTKDFSANVFKKGAKGKLRPDLYERFPRYPTRERAIKQERKLAKQLADLGYLVYSDGLNDKYRKIMKKRRSAWIKGKLAIDSSTKSRQKQNEPKNQEIIPGNYEYYDQIIRQSLDRSHTIGRNKTEEKKRSDEFMDKLRERKLTPLDTYSTILKEPTKFTYKEVLKDLPKRPSQKEATKKYLNKVHKNKRIMKKQQPRT